MRNHTATHLLHAALRKILGTHVHQAGSLVAPDHLRFDFSHSSRVSADELKGIEDLVNEKIHSSIVLTHHKNIAFEEAKKMGALMFFGDKYGDRVNVIEIGSFSKEFCGGTHVPATGDIGFFKFRSEGSVASGVRRVEAVTSSAALELLTLQDRNTSERLEYAMTQLTALRSLAEELISVDNTLVEEATKAAAVFEVSLTALGKASPLPHAAGSDLRLHFDRLAQRETAIETLVLEIAEKRKLLEKVVAKGRIRSQSGRIEELVTGATSVEGLRIVAAQVDAHSMDELKSLGDALRSKLGHGVGLLASILDGKVSLVCVVTDEAIKGNKLEAGKIVGAVAKLLGGGGGGKAHLATAGAKDVAGLPGALASTTSIVQSMLVKSGNQ
jgi:alanyl-tRNA synthetase